MPRKPPERVPNAADVELRPRPITVPERVAAPAAKYHALVRIIDGVNSGADLHLIREDAESSLCGIARSALEAGGIQDEVVCAECVEWLPKRQRLSEEHPSLRR